jgi:hypothetical protein
VTDPRPDPVEELVTDPRPDPVEEPATAFPPCRVAVIVRVVALAIDRGAAIDLDDPGTAIDLDDPGTAIDLDDPGVAIDPDARVTGIDLADPGTVIVPDGPAIDREDPVDDQGDPTGHLAGEIFTTISIIIGTIVPDARSVVAGGTDVILAGVPGDAPVMDGGIGGLRAPSARSAASLSAPLGDPLGRSRCTTATATRAACTTRTTSSTSTVTSTARVKSTTRRLKRLRPMSLNTQTIRGKI